MNVLIATLTLFNLYHFAGGTARLSKGSWLLVFAGVLLPLLDYLYLWVGGQPGLYFTPLYFHNPFYVGGFCAIVALWVWVGTRRPKRAAQAFLPLAGLLLYLGLSLLSTQRLPYLRPFSEAAWSLDLVGQGYLFVVAITLSLWLTKRWTRLKTRVVCSSSLGLLLGFLLLQGAVKVVLVASMPAELTGADHFNAQPANLIQTKWNVASLKRDRYHFAQFNLFSGWNQPQVLQTSNDFELAQALLLDPFFHGLYVFNFQNPVIETKYLNDLLRIEVTELWPLSEPFWTKSLLVTKTASGQVLQIEREKGYLY